MEEQFRYPPEAFWNKDRIDEYAERDARIYQRYLDVRSYRKVGAEFGLSYERVRKIKLKAEAAGK